MDQIDTVDNLQRFDNALIVSRLGRCQLLVSVFWCYGIQ